MTLSFGPVVILVGLALVVGVTILVSFLIKSLRSTPRHEEGAATVATSSNDAARAQID